MRQYQPGQPAKIVHESLKSASVAMEEAKQNAVLWFGEVVCRKLYRGAGYSSIQHYAQAELSWSRSKTYDFLAICQKLEKLPQVKAKVAAGQLDYAHTREIVKVTNPENQEDWLKVALNSSSRKLANEVKRAKQEAASLARGQVSLLPELGPGCQARPAAVVPVRVTLEMSPTQLARYEALWEKAHKLGGLPTDKTEAMLVLLAFYVEEKSTRVDKRDSQRGAAPVEVPAQAPTPGPAQAPAQAPVQIHVHQCPDCAKATVQTSRGELELSPAELEKARCDAQLSRPGRRNTAAIAPKTRREVLSRDRHRCRRPGCGATRFLEVHHKVPRAKGGTNNAENLITLCSGCHQLVHEKGWVVAENLVVFQINRARSPIPTGPVQA